MNKKRMFMSVFIPLCVVSSAALLVITLPHYTSVANESIEWVSLIRDFVTTLSSDEFEGRAAGYAGSDKAAEYIANRFNDAKLLPAGIPLHSQPRSYFQRFHFEGGLYRIPNRRFTSNVIGAIVGSDEVLKHEVVVVGAHYDHLGLSEYGHYGQYTDPSSADNIFNGADDNASGVAGMLAMAFAMNAAKYTPKRSIVFIAFGAEEHGLIGSEIYCRNPTMGDIKQHVFMLNLDMIGRNPYKPVEIIGVGSAAGNALSNICKEAIQMIGLDAVLKPMPDLDGGDSDHSSFYAVGVPFVALFTGLHADYHRVTDHHTHIDYNRAAKIAQVGLYIVKSIADAEYRLQHVGR